MEAEMMTDEMRSVLLYVLWHHQGGHSQVGQPIRLMLGLGQHERMSDEQVAAAKKIGAALRALSPAQQEPVGIVRYVTYEGIARNETVQEVVLYAPQPDGTKLYAAPVPPAQGSVEAGWVSELLEWALSRWDAEVANRPLHNVHRRSLDDTWRQVIRRCGGDDVALRGPRHDDLLAAAPQSGVAPAEKDEARDAGAWLCFDGARLHHVAFKVDAVYGWEKDDTHTAVQVTAAIGQVIEHTINHTDDDPSVTHGYYSQELLAALPTQLQQKAGPLDYACPACGRLYNLTALPTQPSQGSEAGKEKGK